MLVYEPAGPAGRPVPLVRLSDDVLAARAAKAAIERAEARAERLALADSGLGQIEQANLVRLRQVLTLLLPEARLDPPEPARLVH